MKSPMVQSADYIADKGNYTDLQVLRSAAGYYVGTMYEERDAAGKVTWREPGGRDSGYFRTEAEAASYLAAINENESIAEAGFMTRMTP